MLAILSPTNPTQDQIRETAELFARGLRIFVLRMPEKSREDYIRYLSGIDCKYHSRIFLKWSERKLAESFAVGGYYLRYSETETLTEEERAYLSSRRVIVGCHSLEEIKRVSIPVSFFLLSPVFDSISKKGYKSNPDLLHIDTELRSVSAPILAMGGVTTENYDSLSSLGYRGGAVIGAVWDSPMGAVAAFERFPKPAILSIAGQDPSGVAGIDADRETAENLGFKCFTVPTVATTQDEELFDGFTAIPEDRILQSIRFLLGRHPEIEGIKIGMISSLSLLRKVLDALKEYGKYPIVWDPIVAASKGGGNIFHKQDKMLLRDCLKDIGYVTPNVKEYEYWFDPETFNSYQGTVIIKGERADDHIADVIACSGEKRHFIPGIYGGKDRHGTGCRYSTALLCQKISGFSDIAADVRLAQEYVHAYRIGSETSLRFDPCEKKRKALAESFHLQYITNDFSLETIEKALNGGVRWVQIRLKDATTEERISALKAARPLCDKYDAVLILDDDVEAARDGGADGVHLGKNDMSPIQARELLGDYFIIGSTANDKDMLFRVYAAGADYAGIGPYRFTRTKKNLDTMLGVDGIAELVSANAALLEPLPLVAIGGITIEDLSKVRETGVRGIAVSGAIERAEDVSAYSRRLINEWKNQSQNTDTL